RARPEVIVRAASLRVVRDMAERERNLRAAQAQGPPSRHGAFREAFRPAALWVSAATTGRLTQRLVLTGGRRPRRRRPEPCQASRPLAPKASIFTSSLLAPRSTGRWLHTSFSLSRAQNILSMLPSTT